ncbi:class I SAM-dependent methyltransferase [Stigmatella hybrida]|uniref:hypothetical protein n=1 Tax=Stigmatella hybrida TaxID=394097 RepID=UPI001CDA7C0F|nr:hypothetical protein [Stigmatella hybrida]
MSSTNRGAGRTGFDEYPTPAWAVRRLMEAVHFKGGHWLEPCAGEGAIISTIDRADVQWTAVEIQQRFEPLLRKLPRIESIKIGDFMDYRPPATLHSKRPFNAVVTNPPYLDAMEFVAHCLELSTHVAMLLRLNFLASNKRNTFMREHCPDVYVLPDRPSFTGKGTDSIEYAWFVWDSGARRTAGRLQVLPPTAPADRKRVREDAERPKRKASGNA